MAPPPHQQLVQREEPGAGDLRTQGTDALTFGLQKGLLKPWRSWSYQYLEQKGRQGPAAQFPGSSRGAVIQTLTRIRAADGGRARSIPGRAFAEKAIHTETRLEGRHGMPAMC